ncbi:hypothetical protein RSOLAG1IB_07112 [Rhizoctonia solani AG-1 IB]|uniref:Uncharacterized protein n=1 Tax=Thanatephorus cucumeris (strain AG1-IB / isolate 7/3/14) TaxID=1108050 RepID=A0A0B7FC39_THACB|nr:hypothetical protein RSOLAG1IB_07112 [Rhizoctonia solani AG-1 IB]
MATRHASLPSRLGVPVSIPGRSRAPRRLPSLRYHFPVSHTPSLCLRRYSEYTYIPPTLSTRKSFGPSRLSRHL